MTLGSRLANRETVGFDYLRISLSIAVMIWHQGLLAGPGDFDGSIGGTWYAVPFRLILPLFFALSGFLVASSLDRLQALKPFLINRALRIVPALAVEVALSAFLIGPLVTTMALSEYFQSTKFLVYLLNVIGRIHTELPGVFPMSRMLGVMNASLWTVPYELECYVALSILFFVGRKHLRTVLLLALIASCAYSVYIAPSRYEHVIVFYRSLVLFFLAGNLIYLFRDRLPTSPLIATLLLVVSAVMLAYPSLAALCPIVVAYAAAALGCTAPPKSKILRSGDYSYGVYLYAYPMQQCALMLMGRDHPVLSLALAMAAVAGFSVLSWHFVEKPALRLKTWFDRGNVAVAGAQNEGLKESADAGRPVDAVARP